MGGFCHLYLLMILLMRSGDIETNPGPNNPGSTVSEKEFLHLSEHIGPSDFYKLGVNLEIPYAQLDDIKERSNTNSVALLRVFMKWRDRQPPDTNIRAVLAEKLEESGLAELSEALISLHLTSSITHLGYQPEVKEETQRSKRDSTSVSESSEVKKKMAQASEVLISPMSAGQNCGMQGVSRAEDKGAAAWCQEQCTNPPLSPELIERCTKEFKFKYRTTLCKIRADPLDPNSLVQFQDIYTNLVLEEECGRDKKPLEYSDLVNLTVNGEFPRRLLVQGEAGSGKTTLCAKIAWDWINGRHFQEFVWVLVVPLRESKQYTIGEIAKSYLTKDNPTTSSQLTEYIRSNTDKVLLVFDGLDEFHGDLAPYVKDSTLTTDYQSQPMSQTSHSSDPTYQQSKMNPGTTENASAVVKDIEILEILQSTKLEMCPVVVTTRPWKAKEIRWNNQLRLLYSFLHIEGFSKQNLSLYIQKYFAGDDAKANDLIKFANDNAVISENMAPYPIYVAMLCLIWREMDEVGQQKMKSFQTFSEVFQEIFVFLKEHYALKIASQSCSLDASLNDHLSEINKLLEPITEIAFSRLLLKDLVLSDEDFQQCPKSMETACRVGVLSQEGSIIPRKGRQDTRKSRLQSTVFFPHKLFQEYMAGIHLASLYETDNDEYNRLMRVAVLTRKEEFRYLLYFTVSQDHRVGRDVMKRLSGGCIAEDKKHFIIDVAFECHDPQAAALIKDKIFPQRSALMINHHITSHTVAGYAFIGLDLVHTLNAFTKYGNNISALACRDLAEALCTMPNLCKLTLNGMFLHDAFYSSLKSMASSMKVQILEVERGFGYEEQVSMPASRDFAGALCLMPKLTELELDGLLLHDEFYSTWDALSSSMKVQTLRLNSKSGYSLQLTTRASHHLAGVLCSMSNLTMFTLTLSRIHLKDEFYGTFKAMSSSMKVHTLTVSVGNTHSVMNLSATASSGLAAALCTMPKLTKLTLYGILLHDDFYSTLKEMASTIKVHTLTLSSGDHNPVIHAMDVSAPVFWDFGEALCSMSNLMELKLHGMCLHDEFYSSFKAMASSLKVHTLTLSRVRVSAPGSRDLAEGLCSMPNLTKLTCYRILLHDEFYSMLKAKASSMKVQTLAMIGDFVKASGSHDLAVALCSMQNLSELTLDGMLIRDEFYSRLQGMATSLKVKKLYVLDKYGFLVSNTACHDLMRALCYMPNLTDVTVRLWPSRHDTLRAAVSSALEALGSSTEGCFPQISKGNFQFNGALQTSLESFISELQAFRRTSHAIDDGEFIITDLHVPSSSSEEDN